MHCPAVWLFETSQIHLNSVISNLPATIQDSGHVWLPCHHCFGIKLSFLLFFLNHWMPTATSGASGKCDWMCGWTNFQQCTEAQQRIRLALFLFFKTEFFAQNLNRNRTIFRRMKYVNIGFRDSPFLCTLAHQSQSISLNLNLTRKSQIKGWMGSVLTKYGYIFVHFYKISPWLCKRTSVRSTNVLFQQWHCLNIQNWNRYEAVKIAPQKVKKVGSIIYKEFNFVLEIPPANNALYISHLDIKYYSKNSSSIYHSPEIHFLKF